MTFSDVLDRLRRVVAEVASADPNPTDPYRGLYVSDERALALGADEPAEGLDERFALACARLGLADLDRAALALCLAPEAHPDCGRMFGYLHDDLSRSAVSPRLVARLLTGAGGAERDVLAHFDEDAPLRAGGALRLHPGGPLADRAVGIGEPLAAYVVGSRLGDSTAGGRLRRAEPCALPVGRGDVVERVRLLLECPRELPLALAGPDALELLMAAGGRPAIVLDATGATEADARDDLVLTAALEDRVAAVESIGALARERRDDALRRIFALRCDPVLLLADRDDELALADHAAVIVRVPPLSGDERAAAWRAATSSADVGGVADRFQLGLQRIGEAVHVARAEAAAGGVRTLDADLLALGARTVSSRRVGEFGTLMAPGPGWDDLVLPPRQVAALHSLSSYLRHRDLVLGEWGYDQIAAGQGLTALFAGFSGTGKTLAARVVAGTAGLDVYRVDLAGLFSKWIGETEKNLDRIFRAAEESNAVVFFDEADVVFSKRSAVSDASDRYANLETAYLLQRIEEYEGIVVLATNLRSNIDDAFTRRLDLVVDFPAPDAATRRRLWTALLPAGAPLAADIELDFLADRFELTGGGIRNCTLSAAFLAADDGAPIDMSHLVRAVALEYVKLGRLTLESDFERFYGLVREPLNTP